MRVKLSAKADYAVRAVLVLAAHEGERPVKGEAIARSQDLPPKFVENILGELKHAGIVSSQRGPDGGYRLARAPGDVTLADVIRVVERRGRGGAPRGCVLPAGSRSPAGSVAGGPGNASIGTGDNHLRRSGGALSQARGRWHATGRDGTFGELTRRWISSLST